MNPKLIIDSVIADEDGGVVTDADNAPRRALLLKRLQMINDYVHNYRPWEWTFKEGNVTVLVNTNSIALPTDFLEFGEDGSVHDAAGNEWRRNGRGFIERLRKQGANSFVAFCYAIWDGKIQLAYSPTTATVFTLYYRRRAEVLVDNTTAMLIPDRYRSTVIDPGLTARAQESKQDSRDSWFGYLREGLTQMCKLENPMQTRGMRWPSAIRGG